MSDSHELTVPQGADGLAAFTAPSRAWTSLDLTKHEGVRTFLKAKAAPDFSFDDVQGQTLKLADGLVHECEVTDHETGELKLARRTVLIFEDGTSAGFVSEGIIRGLKDLFLIYGPLPWRPAREIVITRAKTSAKKQVYLINLPE